MSADEIRAWVHVCFIFAVFVLMALVMIYSRLLYIYDVLKAKR